MRGMKEFRAGLGPRPTLVDASGTERRIHTYLVTEDDAKTVEQIAKALDITDDVERPVLDGQELEPVVTKPGEDKVRDALSDLARAGLVRGDGGSGYTGVAP